MDSHANAQRQIRERRLHLSGGSQTLTSALEDEEERIALRSHLHRVTRMRNGANPLTMIHQHGGVAIRPKLVQQPRRPLDVGEQHRHRPSRKTSLS